MPKKKPDEITLEELRHSNAMLELQFIRETELLKHNWEKERMRIKSAEIRRSIDRKHNREFMENYPKHG